MTKKIKMKETNLYEIKEKALRSGRVVFGVAELSNLIGKDKNVAKVYLSRLVKRGLAFKLAKGKITLSEDEFIIATQLIEPSYISLLSALNFHGVSQQIPKFIQCVTTKNTFTFENLSIEYHKISQKLFFGYKTYKKGQSYIFVADIEKAILDGIYLRQLELSIIKENIIKINIKMLIDYSLAFPQKMQNAIKELLKYDKQK